MRSKRLSTGTEPTFAVIFDKGDEPIAALTAWADEQRIRAARFTGIGGFRNVTLGFFDSAEKDYRHIPVSEQSEVLALIGDIAVGSNSPQVHAHVVIGLSDGSTRGGHLLRGEVWPTLEVLVTQSPAHLAKRQDPETGLALIDLSSGP